MQKFKETFHCVLKIASPVHLGCDDVYEPTSFIVDEKKSRMTAFDPFQFIQDLPVDDRKKLSHICRKGSIKSVLEIYKFFRNKKASGRYVKLCNGFIEHYKKVLELKDDAREITQNLNQFQIAKTAFKSVDNRPYIPGTAIKGAIRTAYLNALAKNKRIPTQRGKGASSNLQSKLIGYEPKKMETDPFRLIKVSDFMPVGEIQTRIVYAVNKKKKTGDREARGPYQILEVIEPGACFVGKISIEKPQSSQYIRNPATLNAILKSLNLFYQKENKRECRECKNIKVNGIALKPSPETYALRIGRHSGAESITVDGHRSIRIMLGGNARPVYKNHATTLWLSSETDKNKYNKGLLPFGWTVLEQLTPEIDKQLHAEEEAFVHNEMLTEQKRLDDAAVKREKALREKLNAERLKREKEEKKKLEQEREAAFDAMSPEEQDIVTLEGPDIIENKVVEIFNRLNHFTEENKIKAAKAIKKYYQSKSKWKVKKKQKKQFEKVQKIKAVLGES